MHPITLFKKWYTLEIQKTKVQIPSACCLSTIGLDGYPNSRYVSFKEIKAEEFIFTGSLSARKGIEIKNHSKVALTFWWTQTERQVRIQGNATQISSKDAAIYFASRSRDSKIVSTISQQGKPIEEIEELKQRYESIKAKSGDLDLKTPKNWGGFCIAPIRVEFLSFKPDRFHERILFLKQDESWKKQYLQP